MEEDPIIAKVTNVLGAIAGAAVAATSLAYIARYGLDLSRMEICATSLAIAAAIAILLAVGFLGEKFGKLK